MKIYLDACCLNRLFDDQRQPPIRLEAEAISLILQNRVLYPVEHSTLFLVDILLH
jgi:hypothetical protein